MKKLCSIHLHINAVVQDIYDIDIFDRLNDLTGSGSGLGYKLNI